MGAAVAGFKKILGGGDLPTPAAAPAAPTVADNTVQRAAEEEARKRGNAGRASTIFAGTNESTTPTGASKIFLGAGV